MINKKYTKKQILESIKYWQTTLNILNESEEREISVCDAIAQSIITSLKKLGVPDPSKQVVCEHIWPSPMRFFTASEVDKRKFYVVRTGSSSQTSDVYVIVPNQKDLDDPMIIGIEVKEDVSSHMFNPRLEFDVYDNSLRYVNTQFNDDVVSSPQFKAFSNLLLSKAQKTKLNINKKLLDIALILNKGAHAMPRVTKFPYNPKMDAYSFKKSVAKAICPHGMTYEEACGRYQGHIRGKFMDYSDEFVDFMNTYHINDIDDSTRAFNDLQALIFTEKMSIPLGEQYEVRDNEIIRMYFNTLRSKKSSYAPVHYIQYGENIYKLVDDGSPESNFIRPNSPYKLLDYDDDFGGVKVSWRLDLKDNQLQIRGDVKSLPNRSNSANAMDSSTFSVNIPRTAIAK